MTYHSEKLTELGMRVLSNPPLCMVDSILRHPVINPGVSDDYSEGRTVDLPHIPGIEHWLVVDGIGRPVALLSGQFLSPCHLLFHGALMPSARKNGYGPRAANALLDRAAEDHPRLRKLSTMTPAYNRPALHLLARCGMKREGVIRRAHLRHGELHDLILTGKEVNDHGD